MRAFVLLFMLRLGIDKAARQISLRASSEAAEEPQLWGGHPQDQVAGIPAGGGHPLVSGISRSVAQLGAAAAAKPAGPSGGTWTKAASTRTWTRVAQPLSKFRELEAEFDEEDAKAGRSRTEIKIMMVYKVQPSAMVTLPNSNAADVIGELTFLSADTDIKTLHRTYEVIEQDEVEIKLATNPNRAYNHYLRYIGGKPDKDPIEFGIDTVGFKMREIGGEGWLSFPSSLKCSAAQRVGDGCAWRIIRRVKTIHTTCLIELKDDGPRGSGYSFEYILPRFHAPRFEDTFLDFNQKLVLSLFDRAFAECPDAGAVGIIPYGHNSRRCCCFNGNGKDALKNPLWAKEGICLKDDGRKQKVFASMWSMSRVEAPQPVDTRCADGHALYKLDRNRGRCLTVLPDRLGTANTSSYDILMPEFVGRSVDSSVFFDNVVPKLVKSYWEAAGADLWKENNDYVCPGEVLGLHHPNCDCAWAREEC